MSTETGDMLKLASSAEVKCEAFCDAVVSTFRRGLFLVHLGQNMPNGKGKEKWVARLWLDAESFKRTTKVFQTQLERYEKKFGEIKLE